MEQITPSTSPRRSMARKLATLPPIATGLPERPLMSMNEKHLEVDARSPSSSTSGSCHNMLPCIMITPSSPTHEYDYKVHYFELPEPQPSRCRGFFSSIRKAFCPSSSASCTSRNDSAGIALPDSPCVSKYGYTPTDRSWSASRRFRMILALAAVLFFSLHLVALPKMDHGMYEVFSTDHLHHGAESHEAMASSSSWETVSEWQPAPPSHEPARDVKPIDVVELAHPASSLD